MNEVMTMNDMLDNLDGIVDGIAKKYESNPEKDLLCEKYLEELDGLRHTLRNRCIPIPKIKSVIDHGRHTWALDEDGEIDNFAFEAGRHNGPVCTVCGFSFCHHCSDHYNDTDCKTNIYTCPTCKQEVGHFDQICEN